MTYTEWLAASNISAASNALGCLGQGAANSGLGNLGRQQYGLGSFAQGLVAEAQKHAASFKPEVPLTRYDGMTDTQVPVTQEWIDETQRTIAQLQSACALANHQNRELMAKHEVVGNSLLPSEESKPDASRIWEAIVAYSSR